MKAPFRDRTHAGRVLASLLSEYSGVRGLIVLALPRGGVPVGFEVAQALHAPLDVFLVRKLGFPGQEELAMGAIASGGVQVLNPEVVEGLGISMNTVEAVAARERVVLEKRERLYRDERPMPDLRGRTVILVDDGLATGSSMRAAVAALRRHKPAKIVVAVPVAAPSVCDDLRAEAVEVVCAFTPEPFHAVGLWYQDFSEISDEEIRTLLGRAASREDHMTKCKDVMTKELTCCEPEDSAAKAAQAMKAQDIGSVPIVDSLQSKKLVGVVTDRDLAIKIVAEGRDPKSTKLKDVMTREVVTCGPDDDVEKALDAMARHQIRRIPVVDSDKRVIGIIAQADIATRLHEDEKTGVVVEEISRPRAA